MTDTPAPLTDDEFDALDRFAEVAHANARARGFHDVADRLKALAEAVRNGVVFKEFEPDPELADLILGSYYGNRLLLVASELVEAQEEIRHGHSVTEEYEKDGKPEGVPSELADVDIRVGDFWGEIKIKPSSVLRKKLGYNEKRERLHGGKKF